jgi:hypothetical protein
MTTVHPPLPLPSLGEHDKEKHPSRAWRFPERRKETYFEDTPSEEDSASDDDETALASQQTIWPTSPPPSYSPPQPIPLLKQKISLEHYVCQFHEQVAALCQPQIKLNTSGSAVFFQIARRGVPSPYTLAVNLCLYSNLRLEVLHFRQRGEQRQRSFTMLLGPSTFNLRLHLQLLEDNIIGLTIETRGRHLVSISSPHSGTFKCLDQFFNLKSCIF